jgi:hypothetical protein
VRGPGRYKTLEDHHTGVRGDAGDQPEAERREGPERPAAVRLRTPAPAPHPTGELLAQLDPERAVYAAKVAALNDMARSGRIDWAEWGYRVRMLDLEKSVTASMGENDLEEARSAAADARATREAGRQREHEGQER